MGIFKLESSFRPEGDQPQAISGLVKGLRDNKKQQTLIGATGSGKTYTIANVIAEHQRPTLVISHNKTLAAQLYTEFKDFFPNNAVEYFVSYYDYYQPEAYIPHTDVYIEKDAAINDNIDKLRLSATSSLMSRKDVIVVSSVSCIYGLGSPREYGEMLFITEIGEHIARDEALKKLVSIHYERNDFEPSRGKFRVRGDILEIYPAYHSDTAYRVEFGFDRVERIQEIDPLTGNVVYEHERIAIYPAKHFVTTPERMEKAVINIRAELRSRLSELKEEGKLLEAQRLESRTKYDIEMMLELGYCNGIENYSRHISGRAQGSKPWCLIDYFPDGFLTIIDESHVTIPQLRGMYNGDRSRKMNLVDYGFRLPSALDNRPLKFEELTPLLNNIIFVSATPSEYEREVSTGTVEQLIRPTGIADPEVVLRPTRGQVDDLIHEVKLRVEKGERTFVTTLTKRLAEDLANYLSEKGIRVKYLHSEISVIERVEILKDLRLNKFDCLVGINLLREGLDIPEVSLVAVLDADKEGFLRSATSLIQVSGRAARNINGKVIMYADRLTDSMNKAIGEMRRRRKIQLRYNKANNIDPKTIIKAIKHGIEIVNKANDTILEVTGEGEDDFVLTQAISEMEEEMKEYARNLHFEKAIELREKIRTLKEKVGL